jgi:hypothetical protein
MKAEQFATKEKLESKVKQIYDEAREALSELPQAEVKKRQQILLAQSLTESFPDTPPSDSFLESLGYSDNAADATIRFITATSNALLNDPAIEKKSITAQAIFNRLTKKELVIMFMFASHEIAELDKTLNNIPPEARKLLQMKAMLSSIMRGNAGPDMDQFLKGLAEEMEEDD